MNRTDSDMANPIETLRYGVGRFLERPTRAVAVFFVGTLALAWLISAARQYRRLRHFKGPPLAAVSKLWLLKTVGGQRAHLDFYETTRKYGPLARIGPNDILNDDPELLRRMHGVRSDYRRSDWYDGMRFHPSKNNVFTWRDENEHQKLRSKMAAGYSGREVVGLEQKVDDNVLRLCRLIEGYIDAGKPFDFGRKAQYFTLDVISNLAFGEPFGFIETDSDLYEYVQTTEDTVPLFLVTTVVPWVLKIFASPLFKSILPSEHDPIGFGKVMGIAKKFSAERFGPNRKTQPDMLGSFVAHGLNQEEAESEILLQIIAGSDTSATAIRATLLHIITNPHVHARLRAEIASAADASRPVISDARARELPYLQAVVKEGLRIFPPVAGLMAKEVPAGGDVWDGRFIPGGTRVGWSVWAMFRRQQTWGKDAEEFRPERWMLVEDGGICASEEKLREMQSVVDFVFSCGRYQCLGRPIAVMELHKIFFELLRRFDLNVCYPATPWKSINFGIHSQSEFWIRASRRE
ncbi:pisatin demethylase [Colletotrichum musicola]|uniref:Pisatin demethylase n=1 Tax=Colletotrichum musicola TaxID=2175873 RepID=A0A8H6IZT3_9PEZI|nr:pisatin demethylase [Colletotrichum musicola]